MKTENLTPSGGEMSVDMVEGIYGGRKLLCQDAKIRHVIVRAKRE